MTEIAEKEAMIVTGMQTESLGSLGEFFENSELVQWEIENFANFQKEQAKIFAIQNISYWYNEKSTSLTPEINSLVQDFAFVRLIENYSTFSEYLKTEISYLQSLYVIQNFPENFPDFWTNLFQLPEEIVNYFLLCFTNETSVLSINRLERFSIIKRTMNDEGITNQVLTYIFELLTRHGRIGLHILHKFCYWCDISFISDEGAMSLLQTAITEADTAAITLDLFSVVILRLPQCETRDELISMVCDPERLVGLVQQNPTLTDIHGAVGRLVYTVGVLTNNEQLFGVAADLLESSMPAIQAVVPFICTYLNEQEEGFSIQDIIPACYNMIVGFFELDGLNLNNYYELDQQPSALSKIIISCVVLNSKVVYQILQGTIENSDTDLKNIAAQCHLMRCLMEENSSSAKDFMQDVIMPNIVNIFSMISQPFSPLMIIAFDAFVRLCFHKIYHVTCFPEAYLPHVLNILCAIIFDESVDVDGKIKYLANFEKFTQSTKGRMAIDDGIVTSLLGAGDYHFVKAGAEMMACSSEYCQQNAASVLQNIAQNISEDLKSVNCALTFIGSASGAECGRQACEPILSSVFQNCIGNDTSLGLFALAVESTFGDETPMFLSSIIDNFNSPYALNMASRVARNRIKKSTRITQDDYQWFNTLINGLFTKTSSLVNITQGLKIKNNDVDEALKNTTVLVKEHFSMVDDQIKRNVLDFAAHQFRRTLDSVIAYECSMSLLFEFATIDIRTVVDIVSPAPLSLCFAVNWDSLSTQLIVTFKTLRALINKLNTRAENFQEIMDETSSNIGLDAQLVKQFFRRETVKEKAKESDRLFFQKLVLMRASSGL